MDYYGNVVLALNEDAQEKLKEAAGDTRICSIKYRERLAVDQLTSLALCFWESVSCARRIE